MHLSRVQIVNFRNLQAIDVALVEKVVVVGGNQVGKSNFIFALRLVLDGTLADSARQLGMADFWDGCNPSAPSEIQIHLDFANFDEDTNLLALLTDFRLADDHTIARLSYVFRRKSGADGSSELEAGFEFKVFGGAVETRHVPSEVRRRLSLDVLHALRDAEGALGSWRYSPLRPLLDDAIRTIPKLELESVAKDLNSATARLGSLEAIKILETDLRMRMAKLTGSSQDVKAKLGFAPTEPVRIFRSVQLLIDDGKRSLSEASLGSANVMLLALKLAEFAWRRLRNERNYTLLCIEEPEAHLHPHLQRQVFQKLFAASPADAQGLFLTTHSPTIAGIAPLSSIVLLKASSKEGTKAFSLAKLRLSSSEFEDLQRYLDATRAEILFSRGVVFVEGDAEVALVPVFARNVGHDLDELGITVCSVGGVNFSPYVKLASALALPFAVITDWDPRRDKPPGGRKRALDLLDALREVAGLPPDAAERAACETDENRLRLLCRQTGVFLNSSTLEVEIAETTGLLEPLLEILEAQAFGPTRHDRIAEWRAGTSSVDPEQLLAMVADVGKGRLAGRLAAKELALPSPSYITEAVAWVAARV